MSCRRVVRGAAGALAAVVSVSHGCKMVTDHPCVICPSFSKVANAYFLQGLLNKSGLSVAYRRAKYTF